MITQMVQAGEIESYIAYPEDNSKPAPAVIVIHEIFGLNEQIKGTARRFAEAGYVALAVDLFSRGNKALCFLSVVSGLFTRGQNNPNLRVLDGALAYLQGVEGVDPQRIGVIGFCLGGGYSLAFAIHNHQLKAASVYYGNPIPMGAELARACPMVASYAGKDPSIPVSKSRRLEEALKVYNPESRFKLYPEASHSFFNETGPTYRAEDAEDSWQRTLKFFEETMKETAETSAS